MSDKRTKVSLPTIKDVARAAGVSTATVSRVVNGGYISGEVEAKVRKAIEQLGYQPQRRHSKRQAAGYLAVLTEDLTSSFFAQVIAGAQEQASENKHLMLVAETGKRHSQQLWVLSQIKKQPLSGLISAGAYMRPEEWVALYNEIKVPMIVMNTFVNHPKIASVMVNFESAVVQAVQHLISLGHTRIAYLGDYDDPFSAQELRGIDKALNRHGLEYPKDYWISVSHNPEGASQGVSQIMMMAPNRRPTAILAFDDELAIYLLNALRYYNLKVPQDISVVGFDNIPMAAHANPALTTIDIPKRRIGRQMVFLLQKLMTNENGSIGQVIVDGSLVVRNSTGPVPRSG